MPSKRRKYNARFPAGRIKKIMQTDEEVGKVAQAVPIIISRTLELFVESLLQQTMRITSAKNAKTLSPSHMKQCIISERRFDFLKDLVKSLPDVNTYDDDNGGSGGNNEGGLTDAIENIPVMPDSSDQSLSLSGFSGPRHSCSSDAANSKTPRQKTSCQKNSSKEETDSDDCDSVNSEKAEAEVENNSDFVIDEDYDA